MIFFFLTHQRIDFSGQTATMKCGETDEYRDELGVSYNARKCSNTRLPPQNKNIVMGVCQGRQYPIESVPNNQNHDNMSKKIK